MKKALLFTLGLLVTIATAATRIHDGDIFSVDAAKLTSGTLPDARLSNVITAGGPTGNSTTIPVITWDAHGRLTTVTTASVSAGVTSVALTVPSFLSVSGSPITSSGTLAVTLATETANLVFAGPTSGGAATPTFRALVAADIPALAYTTGSGTTGQVTYWSSSSALTSSSSLFWDNTNTRLGVGVDSNPPSVTLDVDTRNTQTNATVDVARFAHTSSATAAANFGSNISLEGQLSSGALTTLGTLSFFEEEVSTGSSTFLLKLNSAGSVTERLRVTSAGNLAIGSTTTTSQFNVGSSAQFQVDSSGNLVKLNNVTTSFPSTQGAANTIFTNDGSGNLSWGAAIPAAFKVDSTGNSANIGSTTITTPGADTYYSVCAFAIATTVGSTWTTPSVKITYTDAENSVAQTATIGANTTNSQASLPQNGSGCVLIHAKSGVAIAYTTTTYASTGTAMVYSVHIRGVQIN